MLLLMYFNNGFAMIHGVQQTPRRRSLLARQTQGLPLRVKEGEMSPNNRLKHERERRGWSQSKLTGLVGTNPATIGRWERGISLPYPVHREKLCELFGKDARALGLIEETTLNEYEQRLHTVSTPVQMSPSAYTFIFDPAIPMLSAETSTLVGRGVLLEQLKQQLYAGGTLAISALNGLPGVGKTSLALTLAHDTEVQEHFQHGILWVGLGTHPEKQELLSRWGVLLGLPAGDIAGIKNYDEWVRTLRALIGMRRMLLIIDDAWHVDDALMFLVGGPNCAYVVTTRFPQIGIQIAANKATVISELSEGDGITLLARFVPELVKRDPATAQSLVRSVGALPLALVLMGKYLRSHAYNEQPRRLRNAIQYVSDAGKRLNLSEPYRSARSHPSMPDGTPVSLQSVIALSDERLDAQTQMMLRALAVFPAKPNSFSEQAAVAVSAVPVETLDTLCDAGLLESNGPERYMLHQAIADYARMQIGEHAAIIYRRMVGYIVHYVETHAKEYDALAQESQNIMTALEEAFHLGMQAEYVQGICAFAPFLRIRGLYDQARHHLQRAYQATILQQNHVKATEILSHLGLLCKLQSEYKQAEIYLQEGLLLARRLDQREHICFFLTHLGAVTEKLGDYARAENYLQEALFLARHLEQPEHICPVLAALGHVMIRQGNYEQAEIHLQEGLALARQVGNKEHISHLLTESGVIAANKENYALARVYFQEALELARQLEYQDAIIRLLINLSGVIGLSGDYAQAESYLQEGLKLAHRLGNRSRTGLLLNNLGSLTWLQGNYTQANMYFQEGLSLARQVNHPWLVYTILWEWGDVHLASQHFTEAQAAFDEVLMHAPEKFQESRARAHYGMTRVMINRGEMSEARRHCEASIAIFEAIGIPAARAARQLLATLPTISPVEASLAGTERLHVHQKAIETSGTSGENRHTQKTQHTQENRHTQGMPLREPPRY